MVRFDRVSFSQRNKFVQSVNLDSPVGSLDLLECFGFDVRCGSIVDQDFESRGLGDDSGDSAEEVGVGEHSVDAGFGDGVFELGRGERAWASWSADASREGMGRGGLLTPSSPRES